MFRPFFDIENENESKDENDQVDEDSLIDNYERYIRSDNIEMKPAVEHPEHRWIAMWETWKVFSYFERRASFTNPDFFKMHIYKDFHGEGLQEVVENMVRKLPHPLLGTNNGRSTDRVPAHHLR